MISAAHPVSELWPSVDRIVDRASSLEDLRSHRIHLLAAQRWRTQDRAIPTELSHDEFQAAVFQTAARAALESIRGAYDGPIIVIKGPAAASAYPQTCTRPYGDLDLLVDDPDRAQRSLTAAGLIPAGSGENYYEGLHHLRPLIVPGAVPVVVEIHRRPNWFDWGVPPAREELLAAGEGEVLGVEGVHQLAPAQHALVLAAHGWVELPLRRLLDLIDVAATSAHADAEALDLLAARWGMSRVWRTTRAAIDALFYGGRSTVPLRSWARNLPIARDRTVAETHLRRWAGAFWALPLAPAVVESTRTVAEVLLPAPADSWDSKLGRARLAIVNRSLPSSEHQRRLGAEGHRDPRFRRR